MKQHQHTAVLVTLPRALRERTPIRYKLQTLIQYDNPQPWLRTPREYFASEATSGNQSALWDLCFEVSYDEAVDLAHEISVHSTRFQEHALLHGQLTRFMDLVKDDPGNAEQYSKVIANVTNIVTKTHVSARHVMGSFPFLNTADGDKCICAQCW